MKYRIIVSLLLCTAILCTAGCAGRSAGPTVPEGVAADIDLTAFSDTAAYAEVSRMQVYTDEYMGKTVMLRGTFRAVEHPDTDGYLYQCVIPDGSGCCTRELEFVLAGEHTYPDDYPRKDKEIVVIGTVSAYTRAGGTFCTLTDAQIFF